MSNAAHRRTTALVVLPLAALVLAGCGEETPTVSGAAASSTTTAAQAPTTDAPSTQTSASPSPTSTDPGRDPQTIVRNAKRATNAAKSTHLNGDVLSNGERMNVDARGQVQGANQEITVKTADQGTVTIRTVSKSHYVKGDRTYWTKQGAPSKTVNLLTDKWVKAPTSKSAAFEKFTLKTLLADMTDGFDETEVSSANTTVTPLTVDGAAALRLSSRLTDSTSSVTVRDDDKNLPLEVKSKEGTVRMTEWDTVPMYAAPPASEQVSPPGGAA